MAHMIENNMISYTGATPWHGLGVHVDANMTPEEMLVAAGMNWEVELRSLSVSRTVALNNGTGLSRCVWDHKSMERFKGVVRTDTGHVFAVPSERYKPVQNLEIARFFHDWCDAGSAELCVVGALNNGAKVWALAKIKGDYAIGSQSSPDKQLSYVMLATSHDGSLRTIAMGTSIYVVCWNTMSAALAQSGLGTKDQRKNVFSLSHRARFTDAMKQRAAQTVELIQEQQLNTADMGNAFSDVRLDDRGRVEFIRRLIGGESVLEQIVNDEQTKLQSGASLIDAIAADQDEGKKPEESRLGKALIDAIVNSPGNSLPSRNGTLWGAVNGVTWYADHSRGNTQESTLNGGWFGAGAQLKQEAVKVAYDMSGARRAV